MSPIRDLHDIKKHVNLRIFFLLKIKIFIYSIFTFPPLYHMLWKSFVVWGRGSNKAAFGEPEKLKEEFYEFAAHEISSTQSL